jgi:rubrerythrin
MSTKSQAKSMIREIGSNRTGVEMSPIDSKQLAEASKEFPPSSDGDSGEIAVVMAEYALVREPVGHMPPPGSAKGAVKSAVKALRGKNATVLLDKLGERTAFERSGVRLYEMLIAKLDALGSFDGGPTREALLEIRGDEAEHFLLAAEALRRLGGDPTAMTPSADIAAVASMGIFQVIGDPRTTLRQSLEAILIAELTDNAAWPQLREMAVEFGDEELAQVAVAAADREAEHLRRVTAWVTAGLSDRAEGEEKAA